MFTIMIPTRWDITVKKTISILVNKRTAAGALDCSGGGAVEQLCPQAQSKFLSLYNFHLTGKRAPLSYSQTLYGVSCSFVDIPRTKVM